MSVTVEVFVTSKDFTIDKVVSVLSFSVFPSVSSLSSLTSVTSTETATSLPSIPSGLKPEANILLRTPPEFAVFAVTK